MTPVYSAVAIAREAWGDDLPDWVEALAQECQRTSQNKAAQVLGYSNGAVSMVIRNKYVANSQGIEMAVRGALMSESIDCPFIGMIGKDVCRQWRIKRKRGVRANRLQIQMARACGECLHFPDQEIEDNGND